VTGGSDGDANPYATDFKPADMVREPRHTAVKCPAFPEPMLDDLARSGLTAEDAKRMRPEYKNSYTYDDPRAGYLIPYFDFHGKPIATNAFNRFRFIELPRKCKFQGQVITIGRDHKYSQPAGSGVRAYLPPNVDWQNVLGDPSIHINFTEGEKKAFAACKAGFVTVGLGGVWNSREKAQMPILEKGPLLQELAQLARGRKITICFDSDRLTNKHIQQAEIALATLLREAGADVFIAMIPPNGEERVGMDDLLVTSGGKKKLKAVLDAAVHFGVREVVAGIRKTQKSNDERHRNVAEAVVAECKIAGRFIRTDESLLYFDGVTRVPIALDSERSRELRAFIDERTGVTGECHEWGVTYERLADTAMTHGKRSKVSKLSRWDSATHTLYVSQSASRMFKVTAGGYIEIDNGGDKVVINTRGKMSDVVVSNKKGSRANFDQVINVPNFVDGHVLKATQARLLWAIYFLAMFFPEAMPTRPIPLFHGPMGSGKTSGYRAALRTIFGPLGQVTVINPKKLDALESVLVNDPIAALDNIDGRHVDLQIALATAATGGTLKTRTLYTTMGQSSFIIDCFVGATSNDPKSFTRGDIVDRLLYFPVARREGFMSERELKAMVDENRPKFWRWMLDTFPNIIKALNNAKHGVMHESRMADFADFAMVMGPVLGYSLREVNAALTAMNAERLNFQADYSPVLGAIGVWVERNSAWVDRWGGKDHDNKDHGKPDKKGYDDLVARLAAPMSAKTLLEQIKLNATDFSYTQASTFGQALRNEQTAIETKFQFKITEDKKEGIKLYSIAPLGGYPTWAKHQEMLKQGKE
jgi:hypothetical protein